MAGEVVTVHGPGQETALRQKGWISVKLLGMMQLVPGELISRQPPEARAIKRLLLAWIAEVEARINKSPQNSSLPPSSPGICSSPCQATGQGAAVEEETRRLAGASQTCAAAVADRRLRRIACACLCARIAPKKPTPRWRWNRSDRRRPSSTCALVRTRQCHTSCALTGSNPSRGDGTTIELIIAQLAIN